MNLRTGTVFTLFGSDYGGIQLRVRDGCLGVSAPGVDGAYVTTVDIYSKLLHVSRCLTPFRYQLFSEAQILPRSKSLIRVSTCQLCQILNSNLLFPN